MDFKTSFLRFQIKKIILVHKMKEKRMAKKSTFLMSHIIKNIDLRNIRQKRGKVP